MPYCEIVGDLFLTESRLCFVANEKNSLLLMVNTVNLTCCLNLK